MSKAKEGLSYKKKYSEDAVTAALNAIKNGMSKNRASDVFGIHRSSKRSTWIQILSLYPWNNNAIDYSKYLGRNVAILESPDPQNSATITFKKFKEIVDNDYLKKIENCNEEVFRLYKLWQEFTNGNVEDEDIQSNEALVDDPEENSKHEILLEVTAIQLTENTEIENDNLQYINYDNFATFIRSLPVITEHEMDMLTTSCIGQQNVEDVVKENDERFLNRTPLQGIVY
ncbi:hypothetical protein ILUMI_24823 [Ignelater luminosus]|uniref:HTH psq-type domain-containing protein n=1 Tax=Ignelater luminosus TaxID=2038154 RepID=A0A8K0CCS6_IGNLU|nr:hypothetical protein ILUMI_24823 [Ignelater luminosus]